MPTITDITRQRKRSEHYSVFVDDQYRFSLSDLELSNSGLRIGQELSTDEVERWEGESAVSKALARAYDLLARRPRSRQELVDYLDRKGYDESTAEGVLRKLTDQHLIDDASFARQWINERGSRRSRQQLILELRRKGIGRELIDEVISEQSPDDERAAIVRLVEKRLRRSQPDSREQTMAYLAGRGFRYGAIKSVLDEEFSEHWPS